MNLSVRELQKKDIELIIKYWLDSDAQFMTSLGVDMDKMPSKNEWTTLLSRQLTQEYNEKTSYATIWVIDEQAVGHCNLNNIDYGKQANMHLHLWNQGVRKKGMGLQLVKLSLPYFFEN